MLKFLSSKPLSIFLFFGICLSLAASSFFADSKQYLNPALYSLLGLLTLTLIVCTLRNWQRLSLSVILIHAGCTLILCGGLVSAAGYVATVNIYEGTSADSAFRWDINRDIDLAFDLNVKKIRLEYYPVAVKIGVLKNGSRHTLIQTKTGETFQVDDFSVLVGPLDPINRSVSLEVHPPNGDLYYYHTSPEPLAASPPTPIGFQLVAFKTPFLKKSWADLTIISGGQPVFSGSTSVNDPLKWNGLKFFLTSMDRDEHNTPFAGIQIVKDQGIPISFSGFAVLCTGLAFLLRQKL